MATPTVSGETSRGKRGNTGNLGEDGYTPIEFLFGEIDGFRW